MHLISPMANPCGGTENRYLTLFEILGESAEVRLWAESDPHHDFWGRAPIQKICPGLFPKGGVLVFVGTFQRPGPWIKKSNAKRVVLIHNLDEPENLRRLYQTFIELGGPTPEVLYACEQLKPSTPEIKGGIQDSPIDIQRFRPTAPVDRPFTVGRMSRDVTEKHHPDDANLYLRLAERGINVRIMGGTCLNIQHDRIETLPSGAMPPEEFLRSLDCFYYRTHPDWFETFGRVNFEALAAGLPLVVEARQGFADRLTSGVDSILLEDGEDPFQTLLDLRDQTIQRQKMAQSARQTAERLFGPSFLDEVRRFYLGP